MGARVATPLLVLVALAWAGAAVAKADDSEVASRHDHRIVITCSSWVEQEGIMPARVLCDRAGDPFFVWFNRSGDGWMRFGPNPVLTVEASREVANTCNYPAYDADCWDRLRRERAVGWAAVTLMTDGSDGLSLEEFDYVIHWWGAQERSWRRADSAPLDTEVVVPLFTFRGNASREHRVLTRDILDDAIDWYRDHYGWYPNPFVIHAYETDESAADAGFGDKCSARHKTIFLSGGPEAYPDGRLGCFFRSIIAHEYFHVIQHDRWDARVPSWFAEGTAKLFTHRYLQATESAASVQEEVLPYWHPTVMLETSLCRPAPRMWSRSTIRDSQDAEHFRGARAVSWLAMLTSEQALVDFINAYPTPSEWEAVFRQTFGLTYDAFMNFWDAYEAFFVSQTVADCGEPDLSLWGMETEETEGE